MFGFNNPTVDPDLYDAEIAALTGMDQSVGATFLGIPVCDAVSVQQLCLQFAVNLLVTTAIVWGFYFPKSHHKGFSVTFMLFSTAVFMLLFFMKSVGIDVSIGLGLFMIFGIMRYRTEMVPIREMTYLFLSIAAVSPPSAAPVTITTLSESSAAIFSPSFNALAGVLREPTTASFRACNRDISPNAYTVSGASENPSHALG